MIKVLIADENDIMGQGLKTILSTAENCEVIGVVNSFDQLVRFGTDNTPDVIVIDFVGATFGSEKLPVITSLYPNTKLIAITMPQPKAMVLKSFKSGVNSYLWKSCSADEIVDAVHETHANKAFYCDKVFNLLSVDSGKISDEEVTLSAREVEIIKLIADGYTNKEIAEKLFLSSHTVNTHRKNIMSKLGLKNTAGIVIYAVQENIVNT